jgi:transposase-like protein
MEIMEGGSRRRISKRGRVGEGRPTKLTPEVVARIAEAVAIGLTDEEAAVLAGVNPDTMTDWRKRSEVFRGDKEGGDGRTAPTLTSDILDMRQHLSVA